MLSLREVPLSYRLACPASLPCGNWQIIALAVVFLFTSRNTFARSDEAIFLDGSRHQGELRVRDERLEFFVAGQNRPVPWPQLDRVVVAQKTLEPPAPPFWWQATLSNGDNFTCQLIEVESIAIICDSAWFQGLRVRRNAIRALERPLGWAPWLRQDLAKEANGWKETRAGIEAPPTVGTDGLTLGAGVRTLQFTPDSPLPLGKVLLRLKDVAPTTGKRWQLRLGVEDEGNFQPIKIIFGGNEPVELQVPRQKSSQQVVRFADPGTLLQVEISPAHIHVSANERLAAWTERGYRSARLRSLSLEALNVVNESESPARLVVQEVATCATPRTLAAPGRTSGIGRSLVGEWRFHLRDLSFAECAIPGNRHGQLSSPRSVQSHPRPLSQASHCSRTVTAGALATDVVRFQFRRTCPSFGNCPDLDRA